MIHRPPDSDFEPFSNMLETASGGSWVMKILVCLFIGLAISGAINGLRGWSTHSHND